MKNPMFYNKEALSLFQKIKKGFDGKIIKGIGKSYVGKSIEVRYSNKAIEVKFDEIRKLGLKRIKLSHYFKNIIIAQDIGSILVLEKLVMDSLPSTVHGSAYAISNQGFSNLYRAYFKMVIPITESFEFHWTIEEAHFSSDRVKASRLGTRLDLENEEIFIIIEYDQDGNRYLIIESKTKQTFKDFANKTHVVRIALGYLTGYYAGNEGCYCSYSKKVMEKIVRYKFQYLRKEMKSLTQPIYANPYSWIDNKKIADQYLKKDLLHPLSIKAFSSLCINMFKNEDLLSALLLIVESSTASLVLRPSGFAIALETLSELVIEEKKERFAPITNKKEAGKFRSELSLVLEKYSSNKYFKDIKTLQGSIDRINQMTNKEKLKAPFKVLNIELSDDDLEVINSRNDFLHGRTPDFRKLGTNRSIEQKDGDLYYASVRLYTLLNMLILKFSGFDGYVVNYTKIYEKGTGYLCNENYYRKV